MNAPILTISDVLSHLLKNAQITEAKLAKALDVPRATINKIHSGKILDPRSSTLNMIANYFGVTIDQLIGRAPLYRASLVKFVQVPRLTLNQIKDINHVLSSITFVNHNDWMLLEYNNIQNKTSKFNLFAIKVESDAMLPYFDDKTTAIIDTLAKVCNRKYVLVHIANTNEIVLRQIFIDGNTQVLKPINDIFESIKLTADDTIIGVVVQTKRDF